MKRSTFLAALTATMGLTLIGCSKQDAPAAVASSPLEAVTAQGKGFTVGAIMSAATVYVLFDPQCPHCGHLWEASLPLHKKAKFVWIPVSLGSPKSLPQGATLLSAASPAETMAEHEKSLLAGQGGIAASASVSADMEAAIKKNTQLLNSLGADSVPYVVAKNQRTGQVQAKAGAMSTAALADFVGVDAQ